MKPSPSREELGGDGFRQKRINTIPAFLFKGKGLKATMPRRRAYLWHGRFQTLVLI